MDWQALNVYLQRAEARLGIMHGIAAALVSGAGLMTLLPVFFISFIRELFNRFTEEAAVRLASLPASAHGIELALNLAPLAWTIPLAASAILPLYALFGIIEQLVNFYFVPHGHDVNSKNKFLPRLGLLGISLPLTDESESWRRTKAAVVQALYREENFRAVIPAEKDTSERQNLMRLGAEFPSLVSNSPERQAARAAGGEDAMLYEIKSGIAGIVDWTTVEEAARAEANLVRVNTSLRILILRYAKALVAFIWTIVILSVCTGVLASGTDSADQSFVSLAFDRLFGMGSAAAGSPLALSPIYPYTLGQDVVALTTGFVWAVFTPWVVSRPLAWITARAGQSRLDKNVRRDLDPSGFEKWVRFWCVVAAAGATIGAWSMLSASGVWDAFFLIGWIGLVASLLR